MVSLPTWVLAPIKLVTSAVRHPNTAQTMTISDGHVEVVPDERVGGPFGASTTTTTTGG
jgi:hypothetical protein